MNEVSIWCIVAFTIMVLSSIAVIFIIINFIIKGSRYHGGCCLCVADNMAQSTMATMIASMLYVSMDLFRLCYLFKTRINVIHTRYKWLLAVNDGIYYLATLLLYVTLIMRVHALFRGHARYAVSPYQVRLLTLLLCFDFIAVFIFVISIYVTVTETNVLFITNNTLTSEVRLALSASIMGLFYTYCLNDYTK